MHPLRKRAQARTQDPETFRSTAMSLNHILSDLLLSHPHISPINLHFVTSQEESFKRSAEEENR